MKRIHPNLNLAATLVAMAFLLGAAGCKNQSGAVAANPFLGPNRVPPPATRALLPGQAQPYYQGDPLPVSQNGNGQPGTTAVAQTPAEPEMPSADGNLAWTTPGGVPPSANAGPTPPSATPVSPPPTSSVVASNEPTVAIPGDENSMRFALPTAAPAEPRPFTPNNPVALTSTQPPSVGQQSTALQLPAPPSSRDVMQAAYTEPVITNSQTPTPSPWRSPQVAQSSLTPPTLSPTTLAPTTVAPASNNIPQPIAAQPMGQPLAFNAAPSLPPNYATPQTATANTMEVRLREVPSPPMPRIRIPGHDASSAVPTIGSTDGFRPRTSMR
jgi:hypothetical protein